MGFANEAAGGAAATADEFNFDTSGVDPNSLNRGGTVAKPGFYPVEVEDIARNLDTHKDGKQKSPHLSFTLLVLADQPKCDGKGSRHYHRVMLAGPGGGPINEFVRDKTTQFGVTAGVLRIEAGKVVNAVTGKPSTPIEAWEAIKGKRFVIELEYDQKADPTGAKKANGKAVYVTDMERVRIKNERLYGWNDPLVSHVTALVDGGSASPDVDADL